MPRVVRLVTLLDVCFRCCIKGVVVSRRSVWSRATWGVVRCRVSALWSSSPSVKEGGMSSNAGGRPIVSLSASGMVYVDCTILRRLRCYNVAAWVELHSRHCQ